MDGIKVDRKSYGRILALKEEFKVQSDKYFETHGAKAFEVRRLSKSKTHEAIDHAFEVLGRNITVRGEDWSQEGIVAEGQAVPEALDEDLVNEAEDLAKQLSERVLANEFKATKIVHTIRDLYLELYRNRKVNVEGKMLLKEGMSLENIAPEEDEDFQTMVEEKLANLSRNTSKLVTEQQKIFEKASRLKELREHGDLDNTTEVLIAGIARDVDERFEQAQAAEEPKSASKFHTVRSTRSTPGTSRKRPLSAADTNIQKRVTRSATKN
eukprot:Clim_evm10s119 gene=Clim_evmTU10s119